MRRPGTASSVRLRSWWRRSSRRPAYGRARSTAGVSSSATKTRVVEHVEATVLWSSPHKHARIHTHLEPYTPEYHMQSRTHTHTHMRTHTPSHCVLWRSEGLHTLPLSPHKLQFAQLRITALLQHADAVQPRSKQTVSQILFCILFCFVMFRTSVKIINCSHANVNIETVLKVKIEARWRMRFRPNVVLFVTSMLCVLRSPCHPEHVCAQCCWFRSLLLSLCSCFWRKLLLLLVFPSLLTRLPFSLGCDRITNRLEGRFAAFIELAFKLLLLVCINRRHWHQGAFH